MRKREPTVPTTIQINGLPLERVYSYKYLTCLGWHVHITSVCSKACQQIGLLYRRFYRYSSTETLKQLYTAFVHPPLEYSVPVWDPHLTKELNALEAVQRFAYRVCTNRWDMRGDNYLKSVTSTRSSMGLWT